MKKIISLFVLALLSSQMWGAVTWGGYFYCNVDSKSKTSLGGGTVSAVSGSTTAYSGANTFSDQKSVTNSGNGWCITYGYYVKLTATPSEGYKFKEWVNEGATLNSVSKSGNIMTYQIPDNLSNDYYIYAIFEIDNGSGNGGNEPAGPTAGSLQSYTVTPGESERVQVANVSIPNFDKAVDLGFDCLWADKNVGAASTSYRGTAYTWAQATALSSSTLPGVPYKCAITTNFTSG